jgi:hypothetical protein
MNRHAPTRRRKGNRTDMNTETTNTPSAIAEQAAHVTPEKAPAKRAANEKARAPKGRKTGKGAQTKKRVEATSKTSSKLAVKKDFAGSREGSTQERRDPG